MKEFIEKLIGMLEELYARNDKTKKMAYEEKDWEKFDLFTHRCEGIYSAISIVNQLAEEYNGGWIPCSERLPSEGQTVLVQDFEDYYEVCNCETKNGIKGFSSWEWWSSANNYLAWQPLPAPYQPKGE